MLSILLGLYGGTGKGNGNYHLGFRVQGGLQPYTPNLVVHRGKEYGNIAYRVDKGFAYIPFY